MCEKINNKFLNYSIRFYKKPRRGMSVEQFVRVIYYSVEYIGTSKYILSNV